MLSRFGCVAALLGVALTANAQLFSEDWDDGNGSSRWSSPLFSLENTDLALEGGVDYAYDYSAIGAASAPNSSGGTTTGVFMQTNTVESGPVDEGESIGIVPLGYALPLDDFRFVADVYIYWDGNSGSTEYATFGIGHDGSSNAPLWFPDNVNNGSGFAWQVNSDGDVVATTEGDVLFYDELFGRENIAAYENITDGDIPGVPTGEASVIGPFNQWVELSIVQEAGVVEFAMNGFVLDTFDTGGDLAGRNLFIGQSDPFNSSNGGNGVVFDNIRVTELGDVEPVQGDFNGDGRVDNGDLNLLLGNWGEAAVPAEWVNGFDTPVDNGELNALLGNWGTGVGSAVPEPTAAVLALIAAAGFIRRRG